jgi:hypothetical protein
MNPFLILWWIGILVCLANGTLALISPAKWMRSWGTARMRELGRPIIVRIVGAAMMVLGVLWAVQGVQMLR